MAKTVKVGQEDVVLDPDILKFDETTINKFLQNFAGLYNYYSEKHSECAYLNSRFDDKLNALRGEKFRDFKENTGGSDKLCEAKVLADPEAQDLQEKVRSSKHNANLIFAFLRAMDKAHDDAIQFSYNIRAEMKNLNPPYIKRLEDVIPHS